MRNEKHLPYKGRQQNWIDKTGNYGGSSADQIDDIWTHADRQVIDSGRHGMTAIVNVGVFVGVCCIVFPMLSASMSVADEALVTTTKVVADVGGFINASANLIFIFLGGFAFFKVVKYS